MTSCLHLNRAASSRLKAFYHHLKTFSNSFSYLIQLPFPFILFKSKQKYWVWKGVAFSRQKLKYCLPTGITLKYPKIVHNSVSYGIQRRTIWCCWTNGENQFKAFSINLNAHEWNDSLLIWSYKMKNYGYLNSRKWRKSWFDFWQNFM